MKEVKDYHAKEAVRRGISTGLSANRDYGMPVQTEEIFTLPSS
jgi:hypothetical protein